MRLIDADALKRRAQRVATEAWKMELTAKIETTLNQFIDWINDAPTIEPEPHYDEWCTDCKEYNQELHYCPRWNKVIKQTVEDLKGVDRKWIPCVDGNEPKANAECWISTNAKYVRRATYAPRTNNQPNGFIVTVGSFGFYEYGKSAKAWMPYTQEPEPYREEGEAERRTDEQTD